MRAEAPLAKLQIRPAEVRASSATPDLVRPRSAKKLMPGRADVFRARSVIGPSSLEAKLGSTRLPRSYQP